MDVESQRTERAEGDCERTRRHANELLDGELSVELETALRTHIATCTHCGRRVTFEAAFLKSISRARMRDGIPSDVEERIMMLLTEWRNRES